MTLEPRVPMAVPAFAELRPDRDARDLIDLARAGDMDAFEAIYRKHSPTIYALCLRLSAGVSSDATELLQDVFIRAWRGLQSFRNDSALSSWLHRLTVNAMLERARGNSRRLARVIPIEEDARTDAPSKLIENGRWTLPRAVASSEIDAMLRNGVTIAATSR